MRPFWTVFFFFISIYLVEAKPLILKENGKTFYELGHYIDILEDPTGNLKITDVTESKWAKKFKASTKVVHNLGFSKSSFWARIHIKNQNSNQSSWLLSQNYYQQDAVKFYRLKKGVWEETLTGDTLPFSSREIDTKSFTFKIEPKNSSFYYMLIRGSVTQMNLTLTTPLDFLTKESYTNYILGLFFGLVLAMLIYNTFVFFSTRRTSYLFYVFYVLSIGLFIMIRGGFAQRFLFRDFTWASNYGFSFLGGTSALFLALFTISYLNIKNENPKMYKFLLLFIVSSSLVILSSFTLPYAFCAPFMTINSLFSLIAIYIAGLYKFKMKFRPAKYFILAFTFFISGGVSESLLGMGILPSNVLTRNLLLVGNAIELILLSMGLADRFNLIQEEAIKKETEAKKLQENYAKTLKTEVNLKTKSIKMLIENLGQGFMVIDEVGKVQEGATKITKEFFNENPEGKNLSEVLGLKSEQAQSLKSWLKNMWQGKLAFKDLKPLGPQSFRGKEGQYIDLDYHPIYEEKESQNIDTVDKIEKIICVATDKTNEVGLEHQLELDKKNVIFIKNALETPSELVDLLEDTKDLIETYEIIKEMEEGELFRKFHTLKARFGHFGIINVAKELNELETIMSQNNLNDLDDRFIDFQKVFKDFVKDNALIIKASHKALMDDGQIVHISEMIEKAREFELSEEYITFLKEKYLISDIKLKFQRYISLVTDLANEQNKLIDMTIGGDEIKVDVKKYTNFINSSIHLFRNMVDHGIETEEVRIENGKRSVGSVSILFKIIKGRITIYLQDDGKGINPLHIKNKILEKKIKSAEEVDILSENELIDMIFLPGFSTKKDVSDLSGRGIGMDAVREEVERLGGTIIVNSKINEGTQFIVELPLLI